MINHTTIAKLARKMSREYDLHPHHTVSEAAGVFEELREEKSLRHVAENLAVNFFGLDMEEESDRRILRDTICQLDGNYWPACLG